MSIIVALAGKGGTGKTTIAALLVRCLLEKKEKSILAIDADPNSNLGDTLGVRVRENMGQIIEDIAKNPDKIPPGYSKDHYIDYKVQTSIVEAGGFDVLTMGLPEGPGCYCYANNVLRGIVSKLALEYSIVIIDNEAGMEHLSRRTLRQADYLLIVSDYTNIGVLSAKKIYNLAKQMNIKIKSNFLLINHATGSINKFEKELDDIRLDKLVALPEDEELLKLSLNGDSIFKLSNSSHLYQAIKKLGEQIWQ